MTSKNVIENIISNKTLKKILQVFIKTKDSGKPGLSITQLSEQTGVERHKLSGILEVLVVLGLLMVFNMGMAKVYILPDQIRHLLMRLKL